MDVGAALPRSLSTDSSDPSSLKNWSPQRGRATAEVVAQAALSSSPAASSEAASSKMQQRRNVKELSVAALQSQLPVQPTLSSQLWQFEQNLKGEEKKDSSWCDCFSTPPSHGWFLNRKGQAEAYSEPGGCWAETASYQAGVAHKILEGIKDHRNLKRLPLTLRYLLEKESCIHSESNEEVVEKIFKLFVEVVAAEKQTQGTEGLQTKVYHRLWSSYHNIISVLGPDKMNGIIQEAERGESFAEMVQQEELKRIQGVDGES